MTKDDSKEEQQPVVEVVEDSEPHPEEALRPRHRRLAELVVAGWTNKQIKAELGYCDSRISILKSNPQIKAYINRLMDKNFEEGVGKRLKALAEPALGVVEQMITDRTNRVKPREKAEMAKWLLEKVDGKAIQKHEVTGGMLINVMDRLDSMKRAGQILDVTPGLPPPPNSPRSLVVDPAKEGEEERELTPEEKEEQAMLKKWADGF